MYPLVDQLLRVHVPNDTDATNQVVVIALFDLKVVGIRARHRVASTSGTLNLVKAASAVALSAGTTLLTAVMSLSGTADTNLDGSLLTTIAGTTVPKDSSLGLVFAGTLTNLRDLDITLIVRQLKKA